MKSFLCFFGFLFVLPVSLLSFVLGILLLVLGQIDRIHFRPDLIVVWDLKDRGWFFRKVFYTRGWVGYSFGCSVFLKDISMARKKRTMKHEVRHCYQQYLFGLLFYPIYVLHSVWIWLFQRSKHSYYDNVFERDARRAAGQRVEVPREKWAHGPYDRWAFW